MRHQFARPAVAAALALAFELQPGPAVIALRTSVGGCGSSSVHEIDVDVVEDASVLVVVYTTDGATVGSLALPVG